MFLNKLSKIVRRIDVRIALAFSLLFLVSTASLFGAVYTSFSKSLARRDHHLVEIKLKEYEAIYSQNGLGGLKQLATDQRLREEGAEFFVRIANGDGKTFFIHAPREFSNFDLDKTERALAIPKRDNSWQRVQADHDNDALEVLTAALGADMFVQVGLSIDDREDTVERLQNLFVIILLFAVAVSGGAAWLLARWILSPARRLVAAIRTIRDGDLQARVENSQTGDEWDQLITLFNDLLDHIQTLIFGLRGALDSVAHDIRTPLTRLRGIAELALSPANSQEKRLAAALGEALESSNEILTLLDSLLDISEAEAGAANLQLEEIPALELFAELKDLYEVLSEEMGLKIELQVSPENYIRADRLKLKRVLANLIDNALKYSSAGGQIVLNLTQTETLSRISVADNGQGISATDLPKIWERFYRTDQARTERGFGLGLSLVRSIIKSHGGTVEVKSEPKKGSVFTVTLPRD